MPEEGPLIAVARALLPPGCGLGAADPLQLYPLLPGEALPRAVPKRLAEFSAGRTAARQAMAALGLPPLPILAGADRAPRWPAGVAGSISHSRSACLAAVSRDLRGIGVDLEDLRPLSPELWRMILTPKERLWVEAEPIPGLAALRVFSAKEAAYKAQYPLSRQIFDFDVLELRFSGQGFVAQFLRPIAPFAKGDQIQGAWAQLEGQMLTLAWL